MQLNADYKSGARELAMLAVGSALARAFRSPRKHPDFPDCMNLPESPVSENASFLR